MFLIAHFKYILNRKEFTHIKISLRDKILDLYLVELSIFSLVVQLIKLSFI